MVLRRPTTVFVLAACSAIGAAGACGTDAVGVETCRQIETARCQNAPGCPDIVLDMPVHSDSDVDACIRFYEDACMHGLAAGADPGAPSTKACVDAINAAGQAKNCSVVYHPETVAACAWLVPASSTADAATEASADTGGAADASADGASD
jgi:hypothetical protein